ncbi:MAG: rRNA maturation RNase YbeY [Verrucomicrobiota bacterium]
MSVLCLRNAQQARRVDLRFLRKLIVFTLQEMFQETRFELGVRLVGSDEMARINETFLHHAGSTDVVTFDYSDDSSLRFSHPSEQNCLKPALPFLHGEIFISIDDAVAQAKEFNSTWQSELARYVIHGILHLRGFDDLNPAELRKMKREENRVLELLSARFPLAKLQRQPKSKNG